MDQTATCHLQEVATQKLNTSKIMFFPDFVLRWGSTRKGCVLHLPCCLCQNPEGPHSGNPHPPPLTSNPPVLLIPPENVTQTHPTLLATAALSQHCSPPSPCYSGVSSHSSTEPGWPPSSMFASHPRSRMTLEHKNLIMSFLGITPFNDVHCSEES